MKDWLLYLFLKLLISFFKILPRQLSIKVGETLAIMLYYLSSRHRKITIDNLRTAYKDIDEKKREEFAKSSFKNLGRVAAEFSRMTSYDKDFIEGIIDIEGWENFENAVKKGKGTVFLTGHLGILATGSLWLTASL